MSASMPAMTPKLKATLEQIRNPGWLCFVWCGLTAGASLLAVPAIFAADTATRPIALDVARQVFLLLGKVELGLLVALLVLIRSSGRTVTFWAYGAVLALIVIAQTAWLVPELSSRTDMIIAGREPPPSIAHAAYSISGLVKLAVLLACGFAARGPSKP